MPAFVRQIRVKNRKNKRTISPKKKTLWQMQNKSRFRSASLTVEAAVVVPIFFFGIIMLWQFFLFLMVQLKVCENVTEMLMSYSHLGYIERKEEEEDVNISWLYEGLLWTSFPNDKKITNQWIICDTQEDDKILIKVKYEFLFQAVFFPTLSFPVTQTFLYYPYVGEYEKSLLEQTEDKEDEIVYMTEHGTVYHISKTCSYLSIGLKSISFFNLAQERNDAGRKYTECKKCVVNQGQEQQVYVASNGTKYHWSLQCSTIKRTILEKKKEEIKEIPLCTKCQKIEKEKKER